MVSAMSDVGPGDKTIGVFLLDDHEIVRLGVRELLEAQPDIHVVGEAGTAASALARIPALQPDVAILDVRLPDGDGVTVCREIRSRLRSTSSTQQLGNPCPTARLSSPTPARKPST